MTRQCLQGPSPKLSHQSCLSACHCGMTPAPAGTVDNQRPPACSAELQHLHLLSLQCSAGDRTRGDTTCPRGPFADPTGCPLPDSRCRLKTVTIMYSVHMGGGGGQAHYILQASRSLGYHHHQQQRQWQHQFQQLLPSRAHAAPSTSPAGALPGPSISSKISQNTEGSWAPPMRTLLGRRWSRGHKEGRGARGEA
jgi:hypothetical protein